MDTEGRRNTPSTPASVAACARQCMLSFQTCLHRAATIHLRELSLVEDQHARLSVWAANNRVFAAGRASLDYRLREAPDIQDVVIGLLEALDYRVQDCTAIQASISPQSILSHDGHLLPLDHRLEQALKGLSDEIGLLHKFSNTVRRASRTTQNLKAADAFQIRDDEGKDVEAHLSQLFQSHIRDRFPGATDEIRDRIVATMVLRRKRILYRRSRYERITIRTQELPSHPEIVRPDATFVRGIQSAQDNNQDVSDPQIPADATNAQPATRSVAPTATTLAPAEFQRASTPSVVSVSRTVAVSSHEGLQFPPAPCSGLARRYAKWKQSEKENFRCWYTENPFDTKIHQEARISSRDLSWHEEHIRQVWDRCLKAIEETQCPFCFCTLPPNDMIDEKRWQRHVLSDLDPYVCLFDMCDTPHELYNHSHTWLQHMRTHTLRWRCSSKAHPAAFVAHTRDEYLRHMQLSHGERLTTAQLAVLADRNARTAGPLFSSCPLCGLDSAMDSGSMEDHIVGHLRKFAIVSLPSYELNLDGMYDMREPDGDESGSQERSTLEEDWVNESSSLFSQDDFGEYNLPESREGEREEVDLHNSPDIVPEESHDIAFSSEGDSQRLHEWGFIPSIHGSPIYVSSDGYCPLKYALMGTHPNDPYCAICTSPASMLCDCEARALEVSVRRAEMKVAQHLHVQIQDWARAHAKDIMIEKFGKLPDSRSDQPVWQTYGETLEGLFSLVQLTLPADDDPRTTFPLPTRERIDETVDKHYKELYDDYLLRTSPRMGEEGEETVDEYGASFPRWEEAPVEETEVEGSGRGSSPPRSNMADPGLDQGYPEHGRGVDTRSELRRIRRRRHAGGPGDGKVDEEDSEPGNVHANP